MQLTKDGFWEEIKSKWPGEFYRFDAWVQDYQKKENWAVSGGIDFYCLPAAMQIGVFLQYCIEENHRYDFLEGQPTTMDKMIDLIKEWFCEEFDATYNSKFDNYDHQSE